MVATMLANHQADMTSVNIPKLDTGHFLIVFLRQYRGQQPRKSAFNVRTP
jgi:hypothetical protein